MQTELQKKLSDLISSELADEEKSVKELVFYLLQSCLAKQDIATMTNAVKTKMDDEIEKRLEHGLLDYDEDDDAFDL